MQIGIDLIFLPDFKSRLNNLELGKIFTASELAQNKLPENFAGVFAAKEAFMKVLGRKIDWHDVWVEKLASGQPVLKSDLISSQQSATVSISHDGEYAVALVIIY